MGLCPFDLSRSYFILLLTEALFLKKKLFVFSSHVLYRSHTLQDGANAGLDKEATLTEKTLDDGDGDARPSESTA